MVGTALHACPHSARSLKLTSPLHSSKHSCFLSGNALNVASQQCPSAIAVRQVVYKMSSVGNAQQFFLLQFRGVVCSQP